jgi:3-isopropylmalate/(R)-2-methylmalate dehydratase small subunit
MSHAVDRDCRITSIEGRAVVLRGNDIDTDRIMPARFLRVVSFERLEQHLFEDDRQAARQAGQCHPLDQPGGQHAAILLVQRNFGCGSSREHAPQAIVRWGLRAVVGESFAGIFFSNATALGLLCATATRASIDAMMAAADRAPEAHVLVDVPAMRVSLGDRSWPVSMPAPAREAFLAGSWDATSLLTAEFDQVRATRARLPYLTGFPDQRA